MFSEIFEMILFCRQSRLLLQGVTFRGTCARSAEGLLRMAELRAVQYTGAESFQVLLPGPGVVNVLCGTCSPVCVDVADMVVSYWFGVTVHRRQ